MAPGEGNLQPNVFTTSTFLGIRSIPPNSPAIALSIFFLHTAWNTFRTLVTSSTEIPYRATSHLHSISSTSVSTTTISPPSVSTATTSINRLSFTLSLVTTHSSLISTIILSTTSSSTGSFDACVILC